MIKKTKLLFVLLFFVLGACSGDKKTKIVTDADGTQHAKHALFDFSCSTSNQCTRTANKFVVQVQGIYLPLDMDFVQKCEEAKEAKKPANKYCKKMIKPGESQSFNTAPDLVQHFLKNGIQPLEGSGLEKRLESARKTVYGH